MNSSTFTASSHHPPQQIPKDMIWSNESDSHFFENITATANPLGFRARPYYGDQLEIYRDLYSSVHGYLSIFVCIFGITANIMNIVVLTRKNMISPTNAIFTGLAVADMLVMMSYIPFSFHNNLRPGLEDRDKYTFGWAAYAWFHAHFSVINHMIATWLTVNLAIWRFMSVCYPTSTMRWRGLKQARIAIICTYIACIVFCIPCFVTFTVQGFYDSDNVTLYKVDISELGKRHDNLLANINFWMFSVFSKLVPCIALSALSFGLLKVLCEANRRRKRLKLKSDGGQYHDRTTKMLLVVLFLFLLTQFPSGILALLSGTLGNDFFENVYLNFGDTMDILSLINSSVNFIIYCSMSRQFRQTFAHLFLTRIKNNKWVALHPIEQTQTIGNAFF